MFEIKGSNRELTKKKKINIFFKSIFYYFDLKRSKSNFFYQKKAIGPVVATALLLVVAVVAVIGFEGWFNSYQSSINAKVEQDSSKGSMNTLIDTVVGSNLYFKNGYGNLTIKDIKIDGTSCQVASSTYSQGLKEIEIGNCTNNATSSTPDIVVITDKGVFSKKIYLKGVKFSTPLYSSCSLDSVNLNHQESYIFYNSTTVPFQDTCSFITRTCNDGVLSGDSSYQYSSCIIEGQDITPDPFNFVNQTDVVLNSIIISNVVVPTGFEGPLTVSITGDGSPQLSINGGSWVISGQINLNDNLTLRLTSSSNSLTSNIANLTLGNYSTLWNVTTKYILNCSTLSLNGGNWITVPGNPTLGNSDFCVMKYEAKNDGSNNAISQASNQPWVSITWQEARVKCEALGPNYHLITDNEWLTIAKNVENIGSNWNSGVVGTGFIYSGHNDNNPSNSLAADINDSNGYYGTNDGVLSPGDNSYNNFPSNEQRAYQGQKRTLRLLNGEVIWDLAGNVWEWVNDSISSASRYHGGDQGWMTYDNDGGLTNASNVPLLKQPSNNWDADNGMGRYYDGANSAGAYNSINEAPNFCTGFCSPTAVFLRGGLWHDGAIAGVFALGLFDGPSNKNTNNGFRCSYTP